MSHPIGTCADCTQAIEKGDLIYCSDCYHTMIADDIEEENANLETQVADLEDEVAVLRGDLEALPPFEDCRRCGNKRYLNHSGYCSPACQDGLTPVNEYAPVLREAIHGKV